MAQDLSYEHLELCFFATIRTINSRLWFVNNNQLDQRVLAYLARYQEMYGVVIYAFIIMGNHYHLLAAFPRGNKAAFFRAFNSIIARLTKSYVEMYEGGKLWARRVRVQAVPRNEDIEKQFLYCALNPVISGLTRNLKHYKSYNSFSDAVYERRRTYEVINWEEYRSRKRFNPSLKPKDFASQHTLTFSRLPGHENLSKSAYIRLIHSRLANRRAEEIEKRIAQGKGFADPEKLASVSPGSRPRSTKTSKRDSHRPLVLTSCMETKKQFLEWYYSLRSAYQVASRKFRQGIDNVTFPPGTYQPPRLTLSSA